MQPEEGISRSLLPAHCCLPLCAEMGKQQPPGHCTSQIHAGTPDRPQLYALPMYVLDMQGDGETGPLTAFPGHGVPGWWLLFVSHAEVLLRVPPAHHATVVLSRASSLTLAPRSTASVNPALTALPPPSGRLANTPARGEGNGDQRKGTTAKAGVL